MLVQDLLHSQFAPQPIYCQIYPGSPYKCAINKLKPIPTGATNVALCFSAASIMIVSTSMMVTNISMKRPIVSAVAK